MLDGVYRGGRAGATPECPGPRFVAVPAPSPEELAALVQTMAERIGRSLEREGLITRDIENCYLAFDLEEEAPIHALLGASITYRIATGPRAGQKVFTLKTPYRASRPKVERRRGMTWAARLERVFAIEIERCWRCGGRLRVIASSARFAASP